MIDLPEIKPPLVWRTDSDIAWIEADLGGARAAFTTRLGGISQGRYSSLNLGILSQDDRDRVTANRRQLATAVGLNPERVAMGWQVHSNGIRQWNGPPLEAAYADPGSALDRVDGHLTVERNMALLVLVADCLPVAIAADEAVAVLHCGWRGTAAGIVARGVGDLAQAANCKPSDLFVALGPAIGPCCYQVGENVRSRFSALGHENAIKEGGRLDLAEVVFGELGAAGIEPGNIARSGLCTSCNTELFFSHRRDGEPTGRQAGIVWRT